MELVKQAYLKGERALFKSHDLKVEDSVFAEGIDWGNFRLYCEIKQYFCRWRIAFKRK